MPITKSMVNEINAVLKDLGCSLHLICSSIGNRRKINSNRCYMNDLC